MIRVLITKPGIDGHWRGSIVVSRALRDAGMEVIFGGNQSVEQIVDTAINEDVDVIGLSVYSGAHFDYAQALVNRLADMGEKDSFLLVCGGAIPPNDVEKLKAMGMANVYGVGASTADIVAFITANVSEQTII